MSFRVRDRVTPITLHDLRGTDCSSPPAKLAGWLRLRQDESFPQKRTMLPQAHRAFIGWNVRFAYQPRNACHFRGRMVGYHPDINH